MNEDEFWRIIDESAAANPVASDEQFAWLEQRLQTYSTEDIVAFENILNRMKARAYTFPLLMANFILQSYVSDDAFEDFRLWLIANGRQRFEAAMADPEMIADFCDAEGPVEEITGEGLLYVAEAAFQEAGGDADFSDLVEFVDEPDLEMPWPETREGYQEAMPKLYDKFWNQERINELHGGEDGE